MQFVTGVCSRVGSRIHFVRLRFQGKLLRKYEDGLATVSVRAITMVVLLAIRSSRFTVINVPRNLNHPE